MKFSVMLPLENSHVFEIVIIPKFFGYLRQNAYLYKYVKAPSPCLSPTPEIQF